MIDSVLKFLVRNDESVFIISATFLILTILSIVILFCKSLLLLIQLLVK